MSKLIILTLDSWDKLHKQLTQDYPPSVIMIREKMRKVLGFTARAHTDWKFNYLYNHNEATNTIHLDFYDESKRTMFLLKYSEFIIK